MKSVFVIGDSISIQYGPYLEKSLAGKMKYARKSGSELALKNLDIAQGANGGTSAQVLNYLKLSGENIVTDILLVNSGLHDIKVGTTPETRYVYNVNIEDYKKNLREIAAIARRKGWTLAWVRTTPAEERIHNKPRMEFFRFREDVSNYNAAADQVMSENDVPLLDLYGFTRGLGGDEIFADHVHFPPEIQKLQGAFIAGWLLGKYS